ncbi:hypothetical protein [Coralliovum pocilloporae]|uniref:hypothetical protein n=1 Tax=Coralliovum pocilloporae TaxID=3066369 RepID=UPI00330785A2
MITKQVATCHAEERADFLKVKPGWLDASVQIFIELLSVNIQAAADLGHRWVKAAKIAEIGGKVLLLR